MGRLRIITVLMGVGFTLQGVLWLVAPEQAAASLGMAALDGLGRSTQFGDFAAFFITLGGSILAGTTPRRSQVLYFPAALLAAAAAGRTVAWLAHGADFAAVFISVETLGAGVLLAAARSARSVRRPVLELRE